MTFKPKDILTLDEAEQTSPHFARQYINTMGKYEYEKIAGEIIEASQSHGSWTPVRGPFLIGSAFESEAEFHLRDMVEYGLLVKVGDGYKIHEDVIPRFVEKYPSSRE
jgi:hypothetical protein